MEMSEQMMLALLGSHLGQVPVSENQKKELFLKAEEKDWIRLAELSAKHMVMSLLFEALDRNREITVPDPIRGHLQRAAFAVSMNYYRMVSLVSDLLALMEQSQIRCYILKGISLAVFYPKEESRSFGDIDLYIPDREQFAYACRILEKKGNKIKKRDDLSDYHISFDYQSNGIGCELELHWKLFTAFENGFDRELGQICEEVGKGEETACVFPMGIKVPVLPATFQALYLLMHMFQHFMSSGFGVKLFCDWTVFWRHNSGNVDYERFLSWIRRLRLERFLDTVTEISIENFGLERSMCGFADGRTADRKLMSDFLSDVLEGGEFGKSDASRMLITTGRPGVKSYMRELHRQMKKRFPRLCRYVILWPALWLLAGIAFLYNNRTLRGVSTRAILSSNEKRSELAKKMDVFGKKMRGCKDEN